MAAETTTPIIRRWPLLCFLVLSPLISAAIVWWLGSFSVDSALSDFVTGLIAGEAAFAVILASWFGRTWLHGYTLACIYLISNCLALYLAFLPTDIPRDRWLIIFFAPSYLLATSAVPLFFRMLKGWIFSDQSLPANSQRKMGIEGIMSATTLIAANFVILKSASGLDESFEQANIFRHLILLAVATAVGTILIVPFGFVALRINYLSGRIVLLIAYGLSLYIVLETMLAGFVGKAGQLGAAIFIAISAFVATLFIGAQCLRWSGFDFSIELPADTEEPLAAEAELAEEDKLQRKLRFQQRALLALWLIVTLGVSAFAAANKT